MCELKRPEDMGDIYIPKGKRVVAAEYIDEVCEMNLTGSVQQRFSIFKIWTQQIDQIPAVEILIISC